MYIMRVRIFHETQAGLTCNSSQYTDQEEELLGTVTCNEGTGHEVLYEGCE